MPRGSCFGKQTSLPRPERELRLWCTLPVWLERFGNLPRVREQSSDQADLALGPPVLCPVLFPPFPKTLWALVP